MVWVEGESPRVYTYIEKAEAAAYHTVDIMSSRLHLLADRVAGVEKALDKQLARHLELL